MSKISVIVPVYNVEKYLDRCVESILAQTYTDFELILVDDGSPDNCPSICDEWAKKDGRIIVIHQQNGGLSAARNAGIDWAFQNSDSEWLTFIDSDDWIHPQYLEILLNIAIENNVKISVCGHVETNGQAPETDVQNVESQIWSVEDFYVQNYANAVIAPAKLYRKECFENIRYPFGKLYEDAYITHLILFKEKNITISYIPLYYYYTNTQSITRSPWSPRRLDEIEAHEDRLVFFKKNNYEKAYRREVIIYLMILMYQIESISKKSEEYSLYRKKLMAKLRRQTIFLRKYIPFKDNKWIYEVSFPKIMKWYWISKSMIGKVKKRINDVPKISIIVPIYNVEQYLDRCINSILDQTYTDFELILVDDGSPDNCPAMCDESAKRDNRITVIHQQNGGLSAARNAGIDWAFQNSDSEWLAFIDSDDWIHPQYLEILLYVALKNAVNISSCDCIKVDNFFEMPQAGYKDFPTEVFSIEENSEHIVLNFTSACFTLYKKSLYQHIRFPVGKLHEDVYTTYLITFNEKFVAKVHLPLYFYYFNPESITKSKWNPKRLDEIDAREQRLKFLSDNNFKKAFEYDIKIYLSCLAIQIKQIEASDKKYNVYKKQLRKKLRKKIFLYRKVKMFKDYIWVYESAYPSCMKLYWIFQSVIKRMKR